MPVKLNSKLPSSEARIEIIPLIDIMFFLLAAFMLVSLSMVHLKTVKVNLPIATSATADIQKNLVNLTINKNGLTFLDENPIGEHELLQILTARLNSNPDTRVLISGDQDTRHGDILRILDIVRAAGIQQVAFDTRPPAQAQP
ncbi:MAG TPA: biopolymer transporter ExbD [Rariglobus sp.]|jgi:biopolymer transport protein ExbD|nr:biopolymer transporter ExbD [Rariglobus sp.]